MIEPATTAHEPARITPQGLQILEPMTFEAWTGMGRKLIGLSNAFAWCIGDWLVYGERQYGRRYRQVLEATGLDYQTLRNYAWVARRFDASRRRDSVSFQHHAEVAALPDADQDLWLGRAERGRWSRNELRQRLSATRRRQRELSRGTLTLQVEVSRDRERRWRDAATAADQAFGDWIATTVDAAADALLVADAQAAR